MASIEKIKLKIEEQEIELSLEELKSLKHVIDDLLGEKLMKEFIPYPVPIIHPIYPRYPYWKVTWLDNTLSITSNPETRIQ